MHPRSISISRVAIFAASLFAWNVSGFCTRTHYTTSLNRAYTTSWILQESSNNNSNDEDTSTNKKEKDDDNSYSWAELQADEKLRQLELKSSINRKNNMLLPQRISQAVTTLGWTFVVTGIVLNSLGFAWVKNPEGGLGIGTLDQRDFQREMYRRSSSSSNDARSTISRADTSAGGEEYIHKWISAMDDEQQTC